MNRLLILLLAALPPLAARGQAVKLAQLGTPAPAAPPTSVPHGPLVFRGPDFGVLPTNPDNTAALQGAVNRAAAAVAAWQAKDPSRTPIATVYLPGDPGTYTVLGPVYVPKSLVKIRGDGPATRIGSPQVGAYPPIVIGMNPEKAPDEAYRLDLFGRLDRTIASAPGQRWGYRTKKVGWAISHGSPLTHGGASAAENLKPDYWRESRYLFVDFAIVWPGTPGAGILFGSAESHLPSATYPPRPLLMRSGGGGSYTATVGYQAQQFGPVTLVDHAFAAPATPGPHRIAFGLDLDARKALAWVDGVQVAVRGAVPAGSALAEQEHSAWYVNGAVDGPGPALDFALYGLSYSRGPKYADVGVGSPQVANPSMSAAPYPTLTIPGNPTGGSWTCTYKGKTTAPIAWNAKAADIQAALQALPTIGPGNVVVTPSFAPGLFGLTTPPGFTLAYSPGMCDGSKLTGQAIPDSYRYAPPTPGQVNSDPWAVGSLDFSAPVGQRHMTVAGGGASAGGAPGCAFLITPGALDSYASKNTIEDIDIRNGNVGYGTAVLLCTVLETSFSRVSLSAQTWGVADLPWAAKWTTRYRDCSIGAQDAAIFGHSSAILVNNLSLDTNGRSAFRLAGCVATVRDVFAAHAGAPQNSFASHYDVGYGGRYFYDNVTVDNEGDTYRRAAFYTERHANTGTATVVDVKNAYLGTVGAVPVFEFRDRAATGPAYPAGHLRAIGVQFTGTGPFAAVDGPGFSGRAENCSPAVTPLVNSGAFPGSPMIRVMTGRDAAP